jgi:hypothetical protein
MPLECPKRNVCASRPAPSCLCGGRYKWVALEAVAGQIGLRLGSRYLGEYDV